MTGDIPNIKRDLLEYALETTEPNEPGNDDLICDLRAFAKEYDYEEHRVANKVFEINAAHNGDTVFDWGVSPMYVWYYDREDVEKALTRVTPGKQIEDEQEAEQ